MHKTLLTYGIAIVLALSAMACVEQSRGMTEADRAALARYRQTSAPRPQHALAVNFSGKLRLLGYDVSVPRVTAGQPFTVTWWWKVEQKLDAGWLQFTHIAAADGQSRINQDGVGFVREHYPPSQWQAGEYIRDEQTITLPEDWNSPSAKLYIGFWKEDDRLHITEGPNDGEHRVLGLTIPVAARAGATPPTPAVPPPPAVTAQKTTDRITIDGRLDETAWAAAVSTGPFVDTMTGAAAPFATTAKLTWDDENLYVGFEVTDDHLRSSFRAHDDHLWEQDAVEVMVDPGADGRNYFEIQVAPTNQTFETRYDSRRQPQPFGHLDWTSNVRSRVALRGTPNDDEADQGYTVELAVPWAAFVNGITHGTKPNSGATWGINLYTMDARAGDPIQQRANAWSAPRVADFHAVNRFARVTFVDPSAPPAAPVVAPAAAPTEGAPAAPGAAVPGLPTSPTAREQLERNFRNSRPRIPGAPHADPH